MFWVILFQILTDDSFDPFGPKSANPSIGNTPRSSMFPDWWCMQVDPFVTQWYYRTLLRENKRLEHGLLILNENFVWRRLCILIVVAVSVYVIWSNVGAPLYKTWQRNVKTCLKKLECSTELRVGKHSTSKSSDLQLVRNFCIFTTVLISVPHDESLHTEQIHSAVDTSFKLMMRRDNKNRYRFQFWWKISMLECKQRYDSYCFCKKSLVVIYDMMMSGRNETGVGSSLYRSAIPQQTKCQIKLYDAYDRRLATSQHRHTTQEEKAFEFHRSMSYPPLEEAVKMCKHSKKLMHDIGRALTPNGEDRKIDILRQFIDNNLDFW
jgi:hypothetical protein